MFDLHSGQGFDRDVWISRFRSRKHRLVRRHVPIRVQSADRVYFGHMVRVATEILNVGFGGKGVSIVLPFRAAEGAEPASKSANVGRIDVDVMVEERAAIKAGFFGQMSEAAEFRKVWMMVEE